MTGNIILTVGETVIPATLNNTRTAKEFAKQLPFKVSAAKGEYDFCGAVGEIPCEESERQVGWSNGDIGYSRGWFALFHSGENESSGYTGEMIIGHIDESYLETLRAMRGSVKITVAIAE